MVEGLKKGSRVTVLCANRPMRINTIKRALKRFYELDDGTKWDTHWDNPYPSSRYSIWSIVPWESKHSELIRLGNLRNRIKGTDWDKIPMGTLEKIAGLLKPEH